jgi:hypothetical protein
LHYCKRREQSRGLPDRIALFAAGRATIFRDYDAALSEAGRLRSRLGRQGEFLDVVPLVGAVIGNA